MKGCAMPDDRKFDLNADRSEAKSAFLNDVEVAAEQVKDQLKAAAEKEQKQAQAARSKKITAVIVAACAVLIVLISYWVVFGKPNDNNSTTVKNRYPTTVKVQVVNPATPPPKPGPSTAAQSAAPTRRPRPDSQVVEHPQDTYEQPGDNSGM
jgi:hypothetical protein